MLLCTTTFCLCGPTASILVGSFVVGIEAVWSGATSFGSEVTGNCDTHRQKVVGNGLQMHRRGGWERCRSRRRESFSTSVLLYH